MSNQNKPIDELNAELYDRHQTDMEDVEHILSVIGERPKKVLEVCCGSGRILVPLGKAGHQADGFDRSRAMMQRIPRKAAGLSNIRWREADAVEDDWGSDYDVVVLAGNILFNIESGMEYKKAQELLIRKAGAALVPGGHVYIQYDPFAPNGRTLTRPGQSCADDGSIFWSWEGMDENGNFAKDAITKGAFDEETGILTFKRFFERTSPDGKVVRAETENTKHYATLGQIRGWLSEAGFSVVFEYENFSGKPIDEESLEAVLYAKKN